MNKLTYLYLMVGVISIMGCSDDPAPNAQVSYQFDFVKTQGPIDSRVKANTIEFSSGFITVREIVFDGESATGSVSITHEQVSVIDFATGVSTPDLGTVLIPAGVYTSVNLGIELQDEADDPTVLLIGTYIDGNDVSVPIRFEFNSGEVFEANAEGPITLVGDQTALAKITYAPATWFSAVTPGMLDNATRDSSGTIVISETSNANIFTLVADGLDNATEAVFQ